jgi:protoporphyrin/coproporphyrin ferrochelatase
MKRYDAIVLLGFGGPEHPEEIRPFLDRVLQGRPIPRERYEEVVTHYEHMPGGKSPYNALMRRQADALAAELGRRGIDSPVRIAYANAAPFASDVVRELEAMHARDVLGVILAVHQSPASWEKYKVLPGADYIDPYYEHPLFVNANAERVRDALGRLGKNSFDGVALIYTAHSIPQAMADRSPYVQQYERSAQLIAQAVGARTYTIAYQSRSGSPSDKWLEPDVRDVLKTLPQSGIAQAIVAPIGFLSDHVEVLYDLDVDAAKTAAEFGVRMERAGALNDHPLFVQMLAELVEKRCAG